MLIRLKDGTQEFVLDHERFKDIVRNQLGADALMYLEDMIGAEKETAIEEECNCCEWCDP